MSLEKTATCVISEHGTIVSEAQVASELDPLLRWIGDQDGAIAAIGLAAGPLSQWLHRGLSEAGPPVVRIEIRQVKGALEAMPIKTDRRAASRTVDRNGPVTEGLTLRICFQPGKCVADRPLHLRDQNNKVFLCAFNPGGVFGARFFLKLIEHAPQRSHAADVRQPRKLMAFICNNGKLSSDDCSANSRDFPVHITQESRQHSLCKFTSKLSQLFQAILVNKRDARPPTIRGNRWLNREEGVKEIAIKRLGKTGCERSCTQHIRNMRNLVRCQADDGGFDVRTTCCPYLARGFGAIHVRHPQIHQDKVERFPTSDLHCFDSVTCGLNTGSSSLKLSTGGESNDLLVFGQQDGLALELLLGNSTLLKVRRVCDGQRCPEAEGRSRPQNTLGPDLASHRFCKPLADRKSQTGTTGCNIAITVKNAEFSEKFLQVCLGDPDTCIRDANLDHPLGIA